MGRQAYTKSQRVQKFMERNAGAKASEIAKATGVAVNYVYVLRSNNKKLKVGDVAAKPKRSKTEPVKKLGDGLFKGVSGNTYKAMGFDDFIPKTDIVNSPAHYKVGGIETIDFIEAKQLGYNLGNVVKYVSRAHYKGMKIDDLKKAEWYLKREIASMEKSK